MRRLGLALVMLALGGCDDGGAGGAGGGASPPTQPERDARLDPPSTPDADAAPMIEDAAPPTATPADAAPPAADAAPDTAPPSVDAAPPPPDAAPPIVDAAAPAPEAFVRFAVLGDGGKGNDGQRAVGAALAAVCAERGGCDFALLNGDNIYDSGVDDADDDQWQTKFEGPYADADFPFYATLGNHDYGAPPILQDFAAGIGIDRNRGRAQVAYAAAQDKFRMPGEFYRFEEGPVEIVSVNTATMFWRDLPFMEALTTFTEVNLAQEATLPQWTEESEAPWRVAFAHHPYLSNGRHGNAGAYDGVFLEGLIGSGTGVRAFLEEHVLGQYDVYFCGHDHNLQDLGRVQGTNLIVSGAAASTTELQDDRNDFVWQSEMRGFVLVEATEQQMDFLFYEVEENPDAEMPWRLAHQRSIRH